MIGAGRDPERLGLLKGIGAGETVSLTGDDNAVADRLGQAAADVDVVIDYLWGPVTQQACPHC